MTILTQPRCQQQQRGAVIRTLQRTLLGSVVLAERGTERVVIKRSKKKGIKDRAQVLESIAVEAEVYMSLDEGHGRGKNRVMHVLDSYEDDEHVCLVLPWCSRGDLLDNCSRKGGLDQSTALALFTQLVEGIEFLHANHVVHRDLSPENIFITDEGAAHCHTGYRTHTNTHTL